MKHCMENNFFKNKISAKKCILLYVIAFLAIVLCYAFLLNDCDFGLIFLLIYPICVIIASFNLANLLKETHPMLSIIFKWHSYCSIVAGILIFGLLLVSLITGNRSILPI